MLDKLVIVTKYIEWGVLSLFASWWLELVIENGVARGIRKAKASE